MSRTTTRPAPPPVANDPAPVTDDPAPPTQPRPRDARGFELDADGLPLCGPERARLLAENATFSVSISKQKLPERPYRLDPVLGEREPTPPQE